MMGQTTGPRETYQFLKHENLALRALARELRDALKAARAWPMEFDDSRLDYVSMQVDRCELESIDSLLADPRVVELGDPS